MLRILWLKDNDPDTWKQLNMLMDHSDYNNEVDTIVAGVIDFLHNTCKLTQFTRQEILHVMGNTQYKLQ